MVEDRTWQSQSQAETEGLTVADARRIAVAMEPKPAATGLKSMLNCGIAAMSDSLTITQKLPNDNYQVYFWVMENEAAYARLFELEVSGEKLPDVGALPLGGWAKYGPCAVKVRNGLLEVVAKPSDGTPQLMGMAIYVTMARPVYLSDLKEIDPKVGHGQFGKRGDLGYDGKRITVKGVESPHGLSMHPPASGSSTVSYRLGKQYLQFRGMAAFDDTVANPPPLTFKVLGDGKVLWEKRFTKGQAACEVDVSSVDLLILEVVGGDNVNSAHAVWVEPLVVSE
jgi:hypothetical protein